MSNPAYLLVIALTLLIVVIAVLMVLTFHKVRRIDLRTWSQEERLKADQHQHFRQIEALIALYWDLKPTQALPATREWVGSPDFLRTVMRRVRDTRPAVVVECSSGTSTLVIARALQLNDGGHVYSLEHEPRFAGETRELLARHGLSGWATVIDAPLIETECEGVRQPWYDLSGLQAAVIDLLVIDGPPESTASQARFPAGPKLFPRLAPGGCVMLDDANRPDERRAVERWLGAHPGFAITWQACEKGLAILHKPS
jgi:predicted O-methyltransferase YrrM